MSGGWAASHEVLGDRGRVVAAVDLEAARAEKVAQRIPGARAETDYHKIMDEVEAALLILPHYAHHPVAMDFLKAGKHVLVEKPMANTEEECLEMIEAADKGKRVLMVGYVLRYHPQFLKLKELLDSKRYGDLFHMSMWTEQYSKFPPDHWVARAKTVGGGQLFSHGCHYIDLLLWYLGDPISGVHVGTNYGTPWMEGEGTSNVAIKFASGAIGYHMGTWGAVGSRHGYAFHAHCTKGMLEATFFDGRIILHAPEASKLGEYYQSDEDDVKAYSANQALVYKVPFLGKNVQHELVHFLDCIESGATPVTNGRDSLQGLRAIWRLYEAERKGAVADLRGLGLGKG
jgi:predicted dehydrogenase